MLADVLDLIFWSYIKTAVCISAFCLPLALLIITRRTVKKTGRLIWMRVLIVANILLALNYGCILLSRQMDTLYVTAFVGYSAAFGYLLGIWLIATVKQVWCRMFGIQQTQQVNDQTSRGLLVS